MNYKLLIFTCLWPIVVTSADQSHDTRKDNTHFDSSSSRSNDSDRETVVHPTSNGSSSESVLNGLTGRVESFESRLSQFQGLLMSRMELIESRFGQLQGRVTRLEARFDEVIKSLAEQSSAEKKKK